MRNISLIQLLVMFFVICLFFVDFEHLKKNLINYYKELKKKNRKKGT